MRKKRALPLIALAGIGSISALGIGEVIEGAEITRIKYHIDNLVKNQDALMENIREVHDTQLQIISQNTEIISVIRTESERINQLINITRCDLGYEMQASLTIKDWLNDGHIHFLLNLDAATSGKVSREMLPARVVSQMLLSDPLLSHQFIMGNSS